uniref:CCHC-type domain-containing protein n=1 Tax=Lepisosteus oculatus TaxID=7918 RepID=W5NLU8_LEPOC
ELCEKAWEKVCEGRDVVPLNVFLIEPLFARELRTLTIHLFNHRVPERDIITFLSRFVDVQGEGQKDLDALRVWTGKRRYTVRLKPKPSEGEGVVHPPAYFTIGPNRGYLFYPGQPVTCKKCFQRGHVAANCPGGVCRKCKATTHETKDCTKVLTCDLCGAEGHVYRVCPMKSRSFADVVRTSAEGPRGEESRPQQKTAT